MKSCSAAILLLKSSACVTRCICSRTAGKDNSFDARLTNHRKNLLLSCTMP